MKRPGHLINASYLLCLFLASLDTLDVLIGGWAPDISTPALGLYFLFNLWPLLAFSGGLALLCAAAILALSKTGLASYIKRFKFHGRPLLSQESLLAGWLAGFGAYIIISTGVIFRSFYGPQVIRIPSGAFFILTSVAALLAALLFLAIKLTRSRALIRATILVFLAAQTLFISRLIYSFSRIDRPMSFAHGLALILLFIFVIGLAALTKMSPRLRPSPKLALIAATVSLISSPFIHCALNHSSHTMRLLVHERTSITYRALRFLPACPLLPAPLQAYSSRCAKPRQPEKPPPLIKPTKHDRADSTAGLNGVIIIMLDTLRADRLRVKRDGHALTPNLNQFADQATSFKKAYSNIPGTRSFTHFLSTGRHKPPHNKPADDLRLADILKKQHITTRAISAHRILEEFAGDFDHYDDRFIEENLTRGKAALTSPAITKAAISMLSQAEKDERFFAFIHYYDVHSDYVPNERFYFGWSEEARYDAEVAFTDYWLGRLLDTLRTSKLWEDTAIFIVSDHGEEFFDHKYKYHLVRLYEESTRIVWMSRLPGQTSAQQIPTPVSAADLHPTILELYGIPSAENLPGRSLASTLRRKEQPDQSPIFLYSENHAEKLGVVRDDYKLIINQHIHTLELYHLTQDPQELHNRADADPELTQKLYCQTKALAQREGVWWGENSDRAD